MVYKKKSLDLLCELQSGQRLLLPNSCVLYRLMVGYCMPVRR